MLVDARGKGQEPSPQAVGFFLGQVGERRLGRASADDLEAELGQPERATDQRTDDVDRLHPFERHPS